MENNIYFCSNCYYMGESEKCPNCDSSLFNTGITLSEWKFKNQEEKERLKENFIKEINSFENSQEEEKEETYLLRNINNNISVIKNVLIAWVSIFIVGIILGVFMTLK